MPFLMNLRKHGATISVIGNCHEDPCHQYADASIFEDYSDSSKLLEICRDGGFDFIVPTCNDYSYVAGSHVAHVLGFPGFDSPEVTAILHTKDLFRKFCDEVGIPVPRTYGEITNISNINAIALTLDRPALVKPVDSFSGRGVEMISAADELLSAAEKALGMSRCKRVVVEEFVSGALHSHTAFISGGKVIWHDFVDEFCETYRYQVDRSAYPSSLTTSMRTAVNVCIESIVDSLGLCDGLLHTQFIASSTEFWIIETMRRCPGDLYGHHFKISHGYDYEAQFVAGFIGNAPFPPTGEPRSKKLVERRVLSSSEPAPFFALSLAANSSEVIYVPLKDSGQKIEPAPFDKTGILFLKGGNGVKREDLWATQTHILLHS